MRIWHASIIRILLESKVFLEVQLSGGKVHDLLSATLFLDIHFDPTTHSYSYAVIDLTLPYTGDKRLFGWDDFPHPDYEPLTRLAVTCTTFRKDYRTELGNFLNRHFVGMSRRKFTK